MFLKDITKMKRKQEKLWTVKDGIIQEILASGKR
jgi:hypothetical protein